MKHHFTAQTLDRHWLITQNVTWSGKESFKVFSKRYQKVSTDRTGINMIKGFTGGTPPPATTKKQQLAQRIIEANEKNIMNEINHIPLPIGNIHMNTIFNHKSSIANHQSQIINATPPSGDNKKTTTSAALMEANEKDIMNEINVVSREALGVSHKSGWRKKHLFRETASYFAVTGGVLPPLRRQQKNNNHILLPIGNIDMNTIFNHKSSIANHKCYPPPATTKKQQLAQRLMEANEKDIMNEINVVSRKAKGIRRKLPRGAQNAKNATNQKSPATRNFSLRTILPAPCAFYINFDHLLIHTHSK